MLNRKLVNIATTSAVLLVTLALNGCASGPDIRSDYDRAADFSEYKTYNFFADAGPHVTNYQSFFSRYMVAAISREMENRGYVKSDDPDLLVNFNAILTEKTDVQTSPAPMYGGYYGYRRGYYDPWMTYGYAQETTVSQYTEGTFNIDLVDARKKKLVWEAVGVGRVSQEALEELEERVNAGVASYFQSYPFTAGSGVPTTQPK
jgi:hypothetical protein